MPWHAGLTIGVTIAGLACLFLRTSSWFGSLKEQLRQALRGISSLHESNSLLLGALTKSGTLSSVQVETVLSPFQEFAKGTLEDLINSLKPTKNPITAADLEAAKITLQRVRNAITHGQLAEVPMQTAQGMYDVAVKIRNEEPEDRLRQELVELAAFILGAATVDNAPD